MRSGTTINIQLKSSELTKNSQEDSVVPDSSEKTVKKTIKFTPEQIQAIEELANLGVFKPFGVSKKDDPNAVYEYADFSDLVRQLLARFYENETGKPFPDDPLRGNPNFY